MNIFILVRTFEQHSYIIDSEWLRLLEIDVNAWFDKLLQSDLPATFFGLQSQIRFSKEKRSYKCFKVLNDEGFLIEARRDLNHASRLSVVDSILYSFINALDLAVPDVLVNDYHLQEDLTLETHSP